MLEDILYSKKSLFSDAAQTVLRGQESRTRRAVMLNGNLVQNMRSEQRGLNSRVYKNGVYGFSSVAEFTPQAAEEVLRAATQNALFLDSHSPKNMPPLGKCGVPGSFVPMDIVDFEQKRIIDTIKEVDDYVAKTYTDLASRTVVYMEDSQEKIIYTSDAGNGRITNTRCYIYVLMNAVSNTGSPLQLFKAFGGAGNFGTWFNDTTWMHDGIDKLHKMLKDKCEGVYAEAGKKTVILGGTMCGMLAHEAVGHTVEADLVLGGSVAGPSLGKQVASPLVNLTDFACEALGKRAELPVYMDDEGVKAEDAVLIKDGILTGYMHNRETADHFGVQSAGNARGWLFSDEPLIRMRNTAVLPGKDKLEDMIASIDDGYYLLESTNGQADLTGEFMFAVNMGYEIKHGKLGKALLDTTVSGVAFEMLKTVDMVSDHVNWSSSGFCGKKQPMSVSMGGPELRCQMMIGGR